MEAQPPSLSQAFVPWWANLGRGGEGYRNRKARAPLPSCRQGFQTMRQLCLSGAYACSSQVTPACRTGGFFHVTLPHSPQTYHGGPKAARIKKVAPPMAVPSIAHLSRDSVGPCACRMDSTVQLTLGRGLQPAEEDSCVVLTPCWFLCLQSAAGLVGSSSPTLLTAWIDHSSSILSFSHTKGERTRMRDSPSERLPASVQGTAPSGRQPWTRPISGHQLRVLPAHFPPLALHGTGAGKSV